MSDPAPSAPSPHEMREATRRRRDENLARIRRVLAVMSGKGGVGKSTVAAALAVQLARAGARTGLLDVDFHGPSVPTVLGLAEARVGSDGRLITPVETDAGLRVLSLGLMLPHADEAVIWRGPMKITVLDQLLGDVAWGELDLLVLDCPPGTGDEALSIAQTAPAAEVLMVATPQEVAMADVRKAVAFCRKLGLRLLGLVETMGTMRCPHCGEEVPMFGPATSRPTGLPLLAEVPFDPRLRAACDEGRLGEFLADDTPTARDFEALATRVRTGAGAA